MRKHERKLTPNQSLFLLDPRSKAHTRDFMKQLTCNLTTNLFRMHAHTKTSITENERNIYSLIFYLQFS